MFGYIASNYKKALSVEGRERRRAFAIFSFFHGFMGIVLLVVVGGLSDSLRLPTFLVTIAFLLLALVILVPIITSMVRRLHDMNAPGWVVIPCMLALAMAMGALSVAPPSPKEGGPNRYGPDPRA